MKHNQQQSPVGQILPSSSTAVLKALSFQPTQSLPLGEEPVTDPLDYSKLPRLLSTKAMGYAIHSQGPYILLEAEGTKPLAAPTIFGINAKLGWKLHISVEQRQLSEAWSATYPILLAYGIQLFKILCPANPVLETAEELNKQITIYAFKNKDMSSGKWQDLIQEVEEALTAIHVQGDFNPAADRRIPGSRYFSYRNDKGLNNRYIADSVAQNLANQNPALKAYNLTNEPDPFEKIILISNETLYSEGSVTATLLMPSQASL